MPANFSSLISSLISTDRIVPGKKMEPKTSRHESDDERDRKVVHVGSNANVSETCSSVLKQALDFWNPNKHVPLHKAYHLEVMDPEIAIAHFQGSSPL